MLLVRMCNHILGRIDRSQCIIEDSLFGTSVRNEFVPNLGDQVTTVLLALFHFVQLIQKLQDRVVVSFERFVNLHVALLCWFSICMQNETQTKGETGPTSR